MKKLLCKLGFHKEKEIGRAIYPYNTSLQIVAYKCEWCEQKLPKGRLFPFKNLTRE